MGEPWDGLRQTAVRRALLAVTVLGDLDLTILDSSSGGGVPDVRLDGIPRIVVPGHRLARIIGDDDPEEAATVRRLIRWLRLRRELAALPLPLFVESLRVVGLPAEHRTHLGPAWIHEVVRGGAVTLGFGLLPGVGPDRADPDPLDEIAARPVPLPAELVDDVLAGSGVRVADAWASAVQRLDLLGDLAAERHRRRPQDPLRPMAEADVVTLLGSRSFRGELAGDASRGGGLAAVIVPMLTRGWVSTSSVDPAFGPAAAAATDPEHRGFPRPLLVTVDEVVQVRPGGRPVRYLDVPAQPPPRD